MRLRLFLLLSLVSFAPAVPANPLAGASLDSYRWQRDKEFAAQAGERFFADLKAVSPEVAANVEDAVRYRLQSEEAARFARQQRYVLAAYAVLWALLVVFAVMLSLRQRRIAREMEELAARLSGKAGGGAA